LETWSWPVTAPVALGSKETLIRQLAPAARPVPQLLVWLKPPVVEIFQRLTWPVPVLVIRIVLAALGVATTCFPKVSVAGEKTSALVLLAAPVPASVAMTGELTPVLATARVPAATPLATGAKVMATVQLCPGARLAPQVVDSPNGPTTVNPVREMARELVLVTLMLCAVLVVPTACG